MWEGVEPPHKRIATLWVIVPFQPNLYFSIKKDPDWYHYLIDPTSFLTIRALCISYILYYIINDHTIFIFYLLYMISYWGIYIIEHISYFFQNMVMTFRVSELQLLLGLAGQSRCGRKTELMQRALTLVDRGVSSSVQLKIKELYQKYTQRLSTGYMFNGTVQGTTSSGRVAIFFSDGIQFVMLSACRIISRSDNLFSFPLFFIALL